MFEKGTAIAIALTLAGCSKTTCVEYDKVKTIDSTGRSVTWMTTESGHKVSQGTKAEAIVGMNICIKK